MNAKKIDVWKFRLCLKCLSHFTWYTSEVCPYCKKRTILVNRVEVLK